MSCIIIITIIIIIIIMIIIIIIMITTTTTTTIILSLIMILLLSLFDKCGKFSNFQVCFCGLHPGNLKSETVRTHKQRIRF